MGQTYPIMADTKMHVHRVSADIIAANFTSWFIVLLFNRPECLLKALTQQLW